MSTKEKDENLSRQDDEIQALSSIFDEEFILDKKNPQKFKIKIKEGENENTLTLILHVEFNPGYPSDAPPIYSFEATWLNETEKNRLGSMLDDIYRNNLGECIVHLWVEKIRDLLVEKMNLQNVESQMERTSIHEGGTKSRSSSDEIVGTIDGDDDDDEGRLDDDTEDYVYDKNFAAYHVHEPDGGDKTADCDGFELPPIHHGELIRDRKSVFQGHLAPVFHKKQVDMVMSKLKENKKIAAATHNIIAYRIDSQNGGHITGCYDDGEIHAGSRMLHLLTMMDAKNVLVVVTRWYGGIHLGTDRFKHINNCTRDLLEQHGYIQEKAKKGPKTNTVASSNENKSTHKSRKHR